MKVPNFASTFQSIPRALTVLALLSAAPPAMATSPSFTNLSQSDVDNIEREMSANTNLHDVLPPSSLGSIFGFELGVVGGVTKTPNINGLVQEANSSASLSEVPHAALVGALTIPFGITAEATYLPSMSMSDVTYQEYALALKWTMTDGTALPLNIAIRGIYAHSSFSFNQTVTDPTLGPVNVSVTNTDAVAGGQLLLSPKYIPLLEPYVGIGYLTGNGSLNVAGNTTSTLFNFTQSQSASSAVTTSQILIGLDVHLLLIGIGAEYSHAFGTDSFSGKLSLKF